MHCTDFGSCVSFFCASGSSICGLCGCACAGAFVLSDAVGKRVSGYWPPGPFDPLDVWRGEEQPVVVFDLDPALLFQTYAGDE